MNDISIMMPRANRLGGPVPKFNDYHIWKALESLDEGIPVGRKRLSQLLGIGEGSTRTILSQLQEQGLITIGKSGILLTDRGLEFKLTYHMDVADVTISDLTIGDKDCAVRVPKRAKDVKFGCEERDAAIKSGATGATTLVCVDGNLVFPGSDYPVEDAISEKVRTLFTLRNDDVVIIGTGPTNEIAEIGAVTAGRRWSAWTGTWSSPDPIIPSKTPSRRRCARSSPSGTTMWSSSERDPPTRSPRSARSPPG